MKAKSMIIYVVISFVSILVILGGAYLWRMNKVQHLAPGTHYYKSYEYYGTAANTPRDEISEGDAQKLEKGGYAYYTASVDEKGKIVKVEKHYKGEVTPLSLDR